VKQENNGSRMHGNNGRNGFQVQNRNKGRNNDKQGKAKKENNQMQSNPNSGYMDSEELGMANSNVNVSQASNSHPKGQGCMAFGQ
jgi:hypothetical protein